MNDSDRKKIAPSGPINLVNEKSIPKAKKRKISNTSSPRKGETSPRHSSGKHFNSGHNTIKQFERGEFKENLKHMMFGFGDIWEPDEDSLSLMESLLVEYIRSATLQALKLSSVKGKLDVDCFLFMLRKDKTTQNRVKELLKANEVLRAATSSGFDPGDESIYS